MTYIIQSQYLKLCRSDYIQLIVPFHNSREKTMSDEKKLQRDRFARIKGIVKELEAVENAEKARIEDNGGEIELKINSVDQALWFVSYKTAAM